MKIEALLSIPVDFDQTTSKIIHFFSLKMNLPKDEISRIISRYLVESLRSDIWLDRVVEDFDSHCRAESATFTISAFDVNDKIYNKNLLEKKDATIAFWRTVYHHILNAGIEKKYATNLMMNSPLFPDPYKNNLLFLLKIIDEIDTENYVY